MHGFSEERSKRLKMSSDLSLGVINVCNVNCYFNVFLCMGIFISLVMLFDLKISNGCCCHKKQVRVLLLHCLLRVSVLFVFCMSDHQTVERT